MSEINANHAEGSSSTPGAQVIIQMGDIFMIDWSPGRGSEQTGQRPAVIVQNNPFNANPRYPNTIVIAVSKHGRQIPSHVQILQNPENGLGEPVSYVKCEQIYTIDKARLGRKVGRITSDQLAAVLQALKRVLNIP